MPASTSVRLDRLRARMKSEKLDLLLSFKPENSFYLGRYNPIIYSHPVIAILAKDEAQPILLVNSMRKDGAESTPGNRIVENYGMFFGAKITGETWQEALHHIAARYGEIGDLRIGIEPELPINRYDQLVTALPGAALQHCDLLRENRDIKDADEIAKARMAAAICNAQMGAAIEALRQPGCTEQTAVRAAWLAGFDFWVANHSDRSPADFGSLEGGDFYSFKPWVLSGSRRFLQAAPPGPGKIENVGVSVLTWAAIDGMHAELERTVHVGAVSEAEKKASDAVRSIRAVIFTEVKPGVPIRNLYSQAARLMTQHGYKTPGRIGHGIGIGAHEHLSIDAKTSLNLTPGMIITIEPNVKIPALGIKTQISDTIVITENGFDYLDRFSDRDGALG